MAAQRLDDPDHPLGVLAAIALKLFSHLQALSLQHVAEVNAQVFEAGLSALLNLQIGVAVARQDRQDGLDRG